MKPIFRSLVGVIIGLLTISVIAELIELGLLLLVTGESFESLRQDQDLYFDTRNGSYFLVGKMVYTFCAAAIAGYLASIISRYQRKQTVLALTGIQLALLLWAGFLSNLSDTGPNEMWIGLCFAVAIGINTGYKYSLTKTKRG